MSSTTFVDYSYSTPIVASWLNDVNTTVYTALGDGSLHSPITPSQVRTNIGAAVAGPIASSGITGAAVAGPFSTSGITGIPTNLTTIATSGNFTTPSNITTLTVFEITLVAGGAGGGAASVANGVAGGGGAGGAVRFLISGLSPSSTYAVVIGAAGSGGTAGGNGGNGGTSQITINSVVYSVSGGIGGTGTTTTTGAQLNNVQGAASASILALPKEVIYQTNSSPATTVSSSYSGSNGASLLFGSCGYGGYTGTGAGSSGTGYGVGGGGAVGGGVGGAGSPGLFEARWIA